VTLPEEKVRAHWWDDRALLALVVLFVVVAPFVTQRIYASDEIKYFAYTHSLFFDHDLDFSNDYLHWYQVDPVKFKAIYTDLYNTREPLTGLPTNEAPIGTGLFWLPSYALTHAVLSGAHALGYFNNVAADGWTQPYISAVCLTSYIFGCIGLLLCYSLAKSYFGRRTAAVAVVVIWLATPLVFYMVIAPPWSHATSLLAVTLFIWYWDRTRSDEGRKLYQWALLGAVGGVMMLVREQDALFLVIPFIEAVVGVWKRVRRPTTDNRRPTNINPRPSTRTYQLSTINWLLGLVIMGVVAFVMFIPQLITYRVVTGRFEPSKVVADKFTMTSPNFLNVLFSPEHGMIPWTPVIAVALFGMFFFWRYDKLFASALLISLALQVYLAGSFLTWQSASSFGQRRFINSTVIFVLGAAALIAWAVSNGVPKWLVAGVAALFVAWNAGLLMQYALWCSPQRQGLDWAVVLKGQLEIPGKALSLLRDFIFDRAKFYRSTQQC
jgi:hypothetical protein